MPPTFTPEELAFRQAILNEPTDDLVRVVYADWLEEHGQGRRAEFIRAQVSGACTTGLLTLPRESADHPLELCPEDPVNWWEYSRGFVKVFHCQASQFKSHAVPVLLVHPVEQIEFIDVLGLSVSFCKIDHWFEVRIRCDDPEVNHSCRGRRRDEFIESLAPMIAQHVAAVRALRGPFAPIFKSGGVYQVHADRPNIPVGTFVYYLASQTDPWDVTVTADASGNRIPFGIVVRSSEPNNADANLIHVMHQA